MIIDTNVLFQFYFGEDTVHTLDVIGLDIEAPDILKIEFINVLRKAHYLNHIPIDTIDKIYVDAISLIKVFYHHNDILKEAKDISFSLNHPIYDCLFLALALKLDQPFVSLDRRLLHKAKSIGISTIDFSTI